jgi:endonuclease YncB( thermonuclease family)
VSASLVRARISADLLGAAAVALSVCPPAAACELSEPQRGTVAQIIDGETLTLTDGSTVRLMGAKAPIPPLGWRGDDPRRPSRR